MSDINISNTSTDDISSEVESGLLMAGVSIPAATTLVIDCWAGVT